MGTPAGVPEGVILWRISPNARSGTPAGVRFLRPAQVEQNPACRAGPSTIGLVSLEEPSRDSLDRQRELAEWLIERYDNSRSANSNRAAIVLSADAIVFAAVTFLVDKQLPIQRGAIALVSLLVSVGALLLLIASMMFAVSGLANVWRESRATMDKALPNRAWFHARDVIESKATFARFEEAFIATTSEENLRFALGEAYTGIIAHHIRYQRLRLAIKLFQIALVVFAVAVLFFLARAR